MFWSLITRCQLFSFKIIWNSFESSIIIILVLVYHSILFYSYTYAYSYFVHVFRHHAQCRLLYSRLPGTVHIFKSTHIIFGTYLFFRRGRYVIFHDDGNQSCVINRMVSVLFVEEATVSWFSLSTIDNATMYGESWWLLSKWLTFQWLLFVSKYEYSGHVVSDK